MAFHGLPERRAQHLPERKTNDLSRPGAARDPRERAAGTLRKTRSEGSQRVPPQDSRHASAAATGSAPVKISKRPELPGDQRDHPAFGQQRGRDDSQRPQNPAATLRAGVPGFPAVHTSNCLMKVNLDDPNLTAFALGELSVDDHAKMAEVVADSPEAQTYVAETQQFARLLRAEYEADRQQPAPRSPIVVRMEEERRASSRYQWGSLAAALAIFGVIAAIAFSTIQRESGTLSKRLADSPKTKQPAPQAPVEAVPEPTVEFEVAQQPAAPQATTAPEFVEEKPSVSRDVAEAGKYGGLALNPSAPPMPM